MPQYTEVELIKKLGIKPAFSIAAFHEPEEYWKWLSPLPESVLVNAKSKPYDFVHWFVKEKKVFEKEFNQKKLLLKKEGMLWVSWPKKSSKVISDLDENIIREFGLQHGLVDVKICSVNEIWSGLKFVYRLADR